MKKKTSKTDAVRGETLDWAREALDIEIDALSRFRDSLDGLVEAAFLLSRIKGKIIVCGLGKSGHIGAKIAASLASLGSPAFFLHAAEALHGDLGMAEARDAVLAISNSGETPEVVQTAAVLKERGLKVVAITKNPASRLARLADAPIIADAGREADPLDLAPTSSSTLTLVVGDLLAVCLSRLKGFDRADFARNHPGGKLGAKSRRRR